MFWDWPFGQASAPDTLPEYAAVVGQRSAFMSVPSGLNPSPVIPVPQPPAPELRIAGNGVRVGAVSDRGQERQ